MQTIATEGIRLDTHPPAPPPAARSHRIQAGLRARERVTQTPAFRLPTTIRSGTMERRKEPSKYAGSSTRLPLRGQRRTCSWFRERTGFPFHFASERFRSTCCGKPNESRAATTGVSMRVRRRRGGARFFALHRRPPGGQQGGIRGRVRPLAKRYAAAASRHFVRRRRATRG